MGSRRLDRELHWRGVLQRQASSGLSVAAFCRQESVSAPSLYMWRRKLAQRDATTEGGAESPSRNGAGSIGPLLPVQIESPRSPSAVRVFLPQGVAVEAVVDGAGLAELLRAVREAH